jgi:hypothetical protein
MLRRPRGSLQFCYEYYGAGLAVLEGQDTETAERLGERHCAVSERTRKSGGEKTRESARRTYNAVGDTERLRMRPF